MQACEDYFKEKQIQFIYIVNPFGRWVHIIHFMLLKHAGVSSGAALVAKKKIKIYIYMYMYM